jgi:CO/xanthine dehydrogenase Mo-binding subunit
VVGETEALAEDGASAVEVEYDPLPAVIDPEAAIRPDSPLTRTHVEAPPAAEGEPHGPVPPLMPPGEGEELSPNANLAMPIKVGDVEAALREADVVVERTYRTHPVHQSYMEPHSVTVSPSPSGHHIVLWPSTQGLFSVRSAVAKAVNMPERQVRVEPVTIGGGFGGKETLLEPLAAAVASHLRRPIRLIYTRQEDLLPATPRRRW